MTGIVGQDPNGRSGLVGKISSLHFGGNSGYVSANNLRLQGTTMILAAGESGFSITDDANARTEFNVNADGDVKVGTGDIIFGTAGKGIVLGATSNVDANTLDDYEEGDITNPVMVGSTTITDYTGWGVKTAKYVKVGRQVTVAYGLNNSAVILGTGSEQLKVNLPFPATTNTGQTTIMAQAYVTHLGGWVTIYAVQETNNLIFWEKLDDGEGVSTTYKHPATSDKTCQMFITHTYHTSA